MAREREIQYVLSMQDEATRVYKSFSDNVTKGQAGMNAGLQDGEQLLKNFYREQRVQDRTMREATQALTGFTVGMSGLLMSGDNTNAVIKQFNTTILSSVTAMQGAEFASTSLGIAGRNLGGRLGIVAQSLMANAGYISALVGGTTATIGLGKALADWLHPSLNKAELKVVTLTSELGRLDAIVNKMKSDSKFGEELKVFVAKFDENTKIQERMMMVSGANKEQIARFIKVRAMEYKAAKDELSKLVENKDTIPSISPVANSFSFMAFHAASISRHVDVLNKQLKQSIMPASALTVKLEKVSVAAYDTSNAFKEIENTHPFSLFMQDIQTAQDLTMIFMDSMVTGFRAAFEGSEASGKTFLKSMLIGTIDMVQGLIIAAEAASFAKATISWGATLIKDLPMLVAATAALQGARAIVNKFHEGGTMGQFGDRIPLRSDERPAILKVGETVLPTKPGQTIGGGSTVINLNFNHPVEGKEFLRSGMKQIMRDLGVDNITDVFVNNRSKIVLAS
jgi:hypothetical protein